MNKFLYEHFPLCYSRIYKAIIQHKGKELVPEILGKIFSGEKDIEKFLDRDDDDRFPRDVYFGLRDIFYLYKNGYAHILENLVDKGIPVIKDPIEAIVLRVEESGRWKRYGSDDRHYDMVLAVPKWSRVVIVSTTEVEPMESVRNVRPFDKVVLENYHLYEFFNKLHGITGRKVRIVNQTEKEKTENLGKLNFLFRTTSDIKKISNCKNLRLFTIIPDINGKPRIGFYFAITCKVKEVKEARKPDGIGLDPYTFNLVLQDDFGDLPIRMNVHLFVESAVKGYLRNEINQFFGSRTQTDSKFQHPLDLKEYGHYMLIFGHWFLGDDLPNVSFIVPLNTDINYLKYQIIGFMNTRKKIPFNKAKELWEVKLQGTHEMSNNLMRDINGEWAYYTENFWDKEIFQLMIETKFSVPQFHEIIQREISREKLKEWTEYTSIYFQINDFIKRLYLSDNPEAEFKNIYAGLVPEKTKGSEKVELSTGVKKTKGREKSDFIEIEIKQIPDVELVKGWQNIQKFIPVLKGSDYEIEEVFEWGNGGKRLAKRWYKHSLKNPRMEETFSVLAYIFKARGVVFLPVEFM